MAPIVAAPGELVLDPIVVDDQAVPSDLDLKTSGTFHIEGHGLVVPMPAESGRDRNLRCESTVERLANTVECRRLQHEVLQSRGWTHLQERHAVMSIRTAQKMNPLAARPERHVIRALEIQNIPVKIERGFNFWHEKHDMPHPQLARLEFDVVGRVKVVVDDRSAKEFQPMARRIFKYDKAGHAPSFPFLRGPLS